MQAKINKQKWHGHFKWHGQRFEKKTWAKLSYYCVIMCETLILV